MLLISVASQIMIDIKKKFASTMTGKHNILSIEEVINKDLHAQYLT